MIPKFGFKSVEYSEDDKVFAININKGVVCKKSYNTQANVILDYDKDDKLASIEIILPKEAADFESITTVMDIPDNINKDKRNLLKNVE